MDFIGHSGSCFDAPENSLAAFEAAITQGADRIELDVQLTRDGVPVVSHDATTEREGDVRVDIEFATAAEFGAVRLADGSPLPTLDDALGLIGDRALLDIELKATGEAAARAVLEVIQRHAVGSSALITSFDAPLLRGLRALGWEGRAGLLIGSRSLNLRQRAYEAWPIESLERCRATDLVIHHQLIHRPLRQAIARRGISLLLWTALEDEARPADHRARLYEKLLGSGAVGVIVARVAEFKAAQERRARVGTVD